GSCSIAACVRRANSIERIQSNEFNRTNLTRHVERDARQFAEAGVHKKQTRAITLKT
ncbi:MAG: hypothetical protein ACI814_001818, partial [Mariniblastus sp.]